MFKKMLYIILITGLILISYNKISTFGERYRMKAATIFSKQAIPNELYEDLLESLHIEKSKAPVLKSGATQDDVNVFPTNFEYARYRGHAANYDTIVSKLSQSGVSIFYVFIVNTMPYGIIIVTFSLFIAIITAYFNRFNFIQFLPQVIESIPVILILLWAHFHIKSPFGWYGGIALVMIPICYRQYVGWINDLKKNNIIEGERMYAEPESLIIRKLISRRWALIISQCFFFYGDGIND